MGEVADRRRGDGWLALALTVTAGLAYALTTAPTVTFGGDCGELAAAAWELGVPHPTGYPLFCLLGRLALSVIPWGEPAWRVALVSVGAGATAVGLVTWTVARLTADRLAATLAGLVLLGAGRVWSQAILVEVYALQLALLAANLAAHLAWWRTRDARWLNLVGLAYGLGLTNHVSTALWLPATAVMLALDGRREWLGRLIRVAAWAAPPLVLYAYLPLRAAAEPALDWGACDTLAGFAGHLTGRSYRGLLGACPWPDVLRYGRNHLWYLAESLRWGAPAALLGLVWLVRRARGPGALLVLGSAACFLFAINYNVGDRANYVLPAYLAGALAAGLGAAAGRRWVAARPGAGTAARVYSGLFVLLLGLLPAPPDGLPALSAAAQRAGRRGQTAARELADGVLAEAPSGSRLIALADELSFAMWYRQIVAGQRPDVAVRTLGSLAGDRWPRALRKIAGDLAAGEVSIAFWDPRLAARYRLVAEGATCRVKPRDWRPPVVLVTSPPAGLRPAPGDTGWRVASAGPASPVRWPAAEGASVPGLKPRTLASLEATWVATDTRTRALEALVVLTHRSLVDELEGRRERPFKVVNDSSGEIVRQYVMRLPFGPTADGFRPAVGQGFRERYPLTLPERSVTGRWEVGLGLVPRADAAQRSPRNWRRLTVPVGEVQVWEH